MRFGRLRKLAVITAAAAALVVPAVATATPAFAVDGNNWCWGNSSDCMNAWNGGPWVKGYTGGDTANGDFIRDFGTSLPSTYLVFWNSSSPWFGKCIGDAYNDPNDARASLDPCPGTNGGGGSGDGWGTHLHSYSNDSICASGYFAFKDDHWNGWVGFADGSNGSQLYLNKPAPFCFRADPP